MSQLTGDRKVLVIGDDENPSAQTKLLLPRTKTGLSLIKSSWEYKLTVNKSLDALSLTEETDLKLKFQAKDFHSIANGKKLIGQKKNNC